MSAHISLNGTGKAITDGASVRFNLPRKLMYPPVRSGVDLGGVQVSGEACAYEILKDVDSKRLLEKASLFLTPYAWREGRLFSSKPANSSDGTFSVTRATTATRTNAAGLVELVPYNLFTYSEQFDNAAWIKENATISINATNAPNGTLTADKLQEDNSLNKHDFYFSGGAFGVPTTTGQTYTISIYAKAAERNFMQIALGTSQVTGNPRVNFNLSNGTISAVDSGITATIESAANGFYRCNLTVTAATTSLTIVVQTQISGTAARFAAYTGTTGSGIFTWGAQLVEGTSALDYQATETRLNIPRLDYSLGSCPNILLEPQRTNLATWSEDFTNAVWTGGAIVTSNAFIAPNGTLTADTLTDNSTTQFAAKQQNFTITPNAVYTASFFVRKTTGAITSYPGLTVFFTGAALPRIIRLILNTTTGTFNYEVSGVAAVNSYSATMTSFNNDYWKVTITTQDNQSNPTYQYILSPAISTDGTTLSKTATGSATFWGAQLEAGAYATSYIPTSSASVTRNQDQISRGNIFTNGLITASGGTWFVDLRGNVARVRDAASQFWLGDTSSTNLVNAFTFRGQASNARMSINKVVGGTTTQLLTTPADAIKVAIKWNGTSADVFVNGVKVVTATAFTTTNMEFLNGFAADVPKYINSMALFPTPLTDGEMSMLTSGVYTPALAYAQLGLVSESPACLTSSVNALL